jgi:ABC-type multidrug transport system ATPase subunit
VSGDILVNGAPRDNSFKRYAAYVLQEDILFSYLTVEQTLLIQARLNLPRKMSYKEKKARVDQIIETLNLTKARKTIIGGAFRRGVSGGERKRFVALRMWVWVWVCLFGSWSQT